MTEPYNAADPKQVKKRQDKAKRFADAQDDNLKALMQLPQFRLFLWNLICARCAIFQTTFHPNGSTFALNAGKQSIGLELLSEIERIDAKLVPQMMTEFAEAMK
jgi:hypothetical protein